MIYFLDELTGMSAQPNPQFESQLAKQLEIVKEAGEMGEFLQSPSSSTEMWIVNSNLANKLFI